MRKLTGKLLLVGVIATSFGACTPKIVGNWSVVRYESSTPGQQGAILTNIGTMTFEKKGVGEKSIQYSALGVNYSDQNPFKWARKESKYMTIEGEGSDFSRTWIIMSNKKNYQKWKATDGAEKVQVIEMKRLKPETEKK
ncbi:MAG: hypothetical protein IT238_05340 [Bacteroidia bacterium]|nr:hypothetical protein [Bacteroidia bacterium]MCZ2249761.1 hypothetical protein [Bacteroidia bacterium]